VNTPKLKLGRPPSHEAVMSFEEIAQALGITKNGVIYLYENAIRKLRRIQSDPAVTELRALVDFRQRREL
jgi:DNA-directed RNA polymerase sigma subunit (sigma70/sigma32)